MRIRRRFLGTRIALAGICLAALAGPAANAASGVSGMAPFTWVPIYPASCFHQIFSGVTYLYIISGDGVQLWTSDPHLVAGFIPICNKYTGFYAYTVDGVNWSYSTYTGALNPD